MWDSVEALAADSEIVMRGTVGEKVDERPLRDVDGSLAKTDIVFAVEMNEVLGFRDEQGRNDRGWSSCRN